ncbi:MAG: iron-only hydrogenase system regulator [Eubacterium sp.]|jgi:putative iron-only hydrogenase system regulator|nr:iron-only hydrogenase system regulator [Eubacterium sp.]
MKKRLAVIGIIVEQAESAEDVNDILHSYREYIVGRMGIPYRQRDMSVISVIVDGPNDVISSMSGKLGMVDGVTSKAVYATK